MMSNTAQTRNFEVISPSRPMRGANPAAPSVLVWDDDPATAMQLQRVFKMHGCTTMAVNFGNEAYLGLRNQEFDLIVMDYQLSLVDARRALEGVPEWVRLSTPFVLISSADRASEARQLGFSAFYVKAGLAFLDSQYPNAACARSLSGNSSTLPPPSSSTQFGE